MSEAMNRYVRGIYKDMLFYYIENIGKPSKYTEDSKKQLIITPRMITNQAKLYLSKGGELPSERDEVNWEEVEAV